MGLSDGLMGIEFPVPEFDPAAPDSASTEHVRRLGDQFLASLNHDIRTPLSGIMGMTDLLLETELSKEQQEYVQTTRFCADQLLEMLNSSLEYAALASGDLNLEETEFHLPEAIREIVEEYRPRAEAKGLTISGRIEDGLPSYVLGDAVRFRQVLWPLLNNALKFTPRGSVEVLARAERTTTDEVTLAVSVRDTGIGIAPDRVHEIFDSYRQLESGLSRTYPGLGLGLAVAKKLTSLMGGDIEVESEPGEGSTFRVVVPMRLPHARPEEGPVAEPAASEEERRHRILLVEDNEVARRVVSHVLRRANYMVDCATGGRDGVDAAARFPYSLILMDLQMPEVNGLEATAAIRRLPGHKTTPVVALSANYSDEFRNHCRDAGFQEFLPKPIQRDDLIRAVNRYVRD